MIEKNLLPRRPHLKPEDWEVIAVGVEVIVQGVRLNYRCVARHHIDRLLNRERAIGRLRRLLEGARTPEGRARIEATLWKLEVCLKELRRDTGATYRG